MKRTLLTGLLIACFAALLPGTVCAASTHGDHQHVAFGETIVVSEGEAASDIVCAFCTVELRGDTTGDLVTFFGTVNVGDGHSIGGDTVMFGGKLTLGNESRVGGDLVFFGGDLQQASSSTVRGDRIVLAGAGWLLLALLPFLIPIGIVWLIVHVVRRSRYRFPAYPGGRRF